MKENSRNMNLLKKTQSSPYQFFKQLKDYFLGCKNPESLLRNQSKICKRMMHEIKKYQKNRQNYIYVQQLNDMINLLSWKITEFQRKYENPIFITLKYFLDNLSHNKYGQANFHKYDYSLFHQISRQKNVLVPYKLKQQGNIVRKAPKHSEIYLLYQKKLNQSIGRNQQSTRKIKIQDQINNQIFKINLQQIKVQSQSCLNCLEYFIQGQYVCQDNFHTLICLGNQYFVEASQIKKNQDNHEDVMTKRVQQIIHAISALYNCGGGVILIGISKNKVEGKQFINQQLQKFQQQISKLNSTYLRGTKKNQYLFSIVPVITGTSDHKFHTNKAVLKIKVNSGSRVISYIQTQQELVKNDYQLFYINPQKKISNPTFRLQNKDIYKFILQKHKENYHKQVHYGLLCNKPESTCDNQVHVVNNQFNSNQEIQEHLKKKEEQNKLSPKKYQNFSILIVKADKSAQNNLYEQRLNIIKQFLEQNFKESFLEDIFSQEQNGLDSKVYLLSHKKPFRQINRELRKKIPFVKIYDITSLIVITSEKNKLNNEILNQLSTKIQYNFTFGRCQFKNSKTGQYNKRDFIQILDIKKAIICLLQLRISDYKCIFCHKEDIQQIQSKSYEYKSNETHQA